MLRARYYLYLDADADTDATSAQIEPNVEEPKSGQAAEEGVIPQEGPVSSPAPETEVPDIDTLSQRAIEHYDSLHQQRKGNSLHYATQSGRQGGTGGRSRGAKAGIAVGVILGVGLVGVAIGAAVAVSNWDESWE
jgi:hypothetical protein